MLLVTWNVNSLRVRLPRVLDLLARHRPDVVCLQETKSPSDGFPLAELLGAGYRSVHHSGGRWAGVAILAREDHDVRDPLLGLPGEPDASEARWCEATVAGMRIASVYVPNGRGLESPEFPRKLTFLDAMVGRIHTLAGTGEQEPLVIAGDFNIAPADLDVYDPVAFAGSTHVTPAERGRLEAMLGAGMHDAYRELHAGEVGYTWWDYRAGHFHKRLGLRIDLVLVHRSLVAQLRACGIDRDFRKGTKPSDHAPLIVEL